MRTVKETKKEQITIYYSLCTMNINPALRKGWFTYLTIVENDKITSFGKFYFKFNNPFYNSLKELIKQTFSKYDVKIYIDNKSNYRKIKKLPREFKEYDLIGDDYEIIY